MKNKYKKILTVFLAVSMVTMTVVFSGCTEEQEETAEQTLVVGTTDKATTLDPADCYDYFSSNVLFNTCEQLITYEPGTTQVTGGLAKDWEISDDKLTYTFDLREGVTFHDGTEMTSSDVEFSLERARDAGGDPGFLLGNIDDVEPVDDYTVKIHVKEPSTPFLTKLGYTVGSIISEESYPDADAADPFKPQEVVGTGPYKLDEWTQGEEVRLTAFEDYWGDQAYAKDVTIEIYGESSQLQNAMETGEIDVLYRDVTPVQKQSLIDNEDVQTKEVASPYIRYLVLNVQSEPVDDKQVRQAFACALDRDQINEDVYSGEVEPLYSMIPNGMWGHESVFERYGTDGANISGAQELLESAGYSESDPLDITLHYTTTHYGPLENSLAQVVAEQFEATDMIEVELESAEWSRYTEDMVDGAMGTFLLGWYPDYFDPDDYISPFLTPGGASSLGSFYNDTEMTEMITEEQRLVEQDERTEVFADIQDKLAEDCPYIPIYQGTSFAAYGQNIEEDSVILGPVQIFRYYTIQEEGWER